MSPTPGQMRLPTYTICQIIAQSHDAGRYRLPDRLQKSGEPNRVPSPVASRGQLDISTLSLTLTSLHLRECLINKIDLQYCSIAEKKLSPLPGDNLSPCRAALVRSAGQFPTIRFERKLQLPNNSCKSTLHTTQLIHSFDLIMTVDSVRGDKSFPTAVSAELRHREMIATLRLSLCHNA
jgi:hypothetical protein